MRLRLVLGVTWLSLIVSCMPPSAYGHELARLSLGIYAPGPLVHATVAERLQLSPLDGRERDDTEGAWLQSGRGFLLFAAALVVLAALMLVFSRRRRISRAERAQGTGVASSGPVTRAFDEGTGSNGNYDPLTSLPTLTLFDDRLEQARAAAERRGTDVALVFLGLDDFSAVRERFGSAVGDDVLIEISRRMLFGMRKGDSISRLDDDGFLVMFTDINRRKEGLLLLERVMARLASPFAFGEATVDIAFNAGLTFFSRGVTAGNTALIEQARQAMREAKMAGKNQFRLFDRIDDEKLRAGIEDISTALEQGDFELHYQPVVNMRDGSLHGVEALLRWQKADGSVCMPGEFLPTITDHPLERSLGDWVLATAIAQRATWLAAGLDISISINVSTAQISRSGFMPRLREYLAAHHLERDNCGLMLEVLESSALADVDRVCEVMHQCAPLGVRFALDDFGTGYSSLSHLKDLPVSRMKIDQRFVLDMFQSSDDFAMLCAIVGMGRTFGRELVAEGVESIAQGEVLLALGCELGQGYAVSHALDPSALQEWWQDWRAPDPWSTRKQDVAARADVVPVAARELWSRRLGQSS